MGALSRLGSGEQHLSDQGPQTGAVDRRIQRAATVPHAHALGGALRLRGARHAVEAPEAKVDDRPLPVQPGGARRAHQPAGEERPGAGEHRW